MRKHNTKWHHYEVADKIADEYVSSNHFWPSKDPIPDIKHAFFNGFLEGGEQSYALGKEAGARDAHGKWLEHKDFAPINPGQYLVFRPGQAQTHTIEDALTIVAKQKGDTVKTWYLPLPLPPLLTNR